MVWGMFAPDMVLLWLPCAQVSLRLQKTLSTRLNSLMGDVVGSSPRHATPLVAAGTSVPSALHDVIEDEAASHLEKLAAAEAGNVASAAAANRLQRYRSAGLRPVLQRAVSSTQPSSMVLRRTSSAPGLVARPGVVLDKRELRALMSDVLSVMNSVEVQPHRSAPTPRHTQASIEALAEKPCTTHAQGLTSSARPTAESSSQPRRWWLQLREKLTASWRERRSAVSLAWRLLPKRAFAVLVLLILMYVVYTVSPGALSNWRPAAVGTLALGNPIPECSCRF